MKYPQRSNEVDHINKISEFKTRMLNVRDRIRGMIDKNEDNSEYSLQTYYSFMDRSNIFINKLENILELSENLTVRRSSRMIPKESLYLTTKERTASWSWSGSHHRDFKQKIFSAFEINDYLFEQFDKSNILFNNDKEKSIAENYLKTSFFEYFLKRIKNPEMEKVCISIIPVNKGDIELKNDRISILHQFLQALIAPFLIFFNDIHPEYVGTFLKDTKSGMYIQAEGFGIYDLLRHEEGIHLVTTSHEGNIPYFVRVFTYKGNDGWEEEVKKYNNNFIRWTEEMQRGNTDVQSCPVNYGKLIRIYSRDPGNNKMLMTDMRTELMINRSNSDFNFDSFSGLQVLNGNRLADEE